MKKGFTLAELLIVISLLAIIALITMPIIVNVIKSSKENAFIDNGYTLMSALRTYQVAENKPITIDFTNKTNTNVLSLNNDLPDGGTMSIDNNGKIKLALWDNDLKICITKAKEEKHIKKNKTLTKSTCK